MVIGYITRWNMLQTRSIKLSSNAMRQPGWDKNLQIFFTIGLAFQLTIYNDWLMSPTN